jgi:hypothetical protein
MIGRYSPTSANAPPYGYLWTSVKSLKAFLSGGYPIRALTQNLLNPTMSKTNNYGGTLSRQVVTLTLNMTFSGNISEMPADLGSLVYVKNGIATTWTQQYLK